MKRACLFLLAIIHVASLAGAQQPGRAAEIQESLQTRYRLTRVGPRVLGIGNSGENSIRHAGGVVVLRKEGLFGSLKRNQLISMSITGTKVGVLSGAKEASVPLDGGSSLLCSRCKREFGCGDGGAAQHGIRHIRQPDWAALGKSQLLL